MSLIYITRCDLCQSREQEWPDSRAFPDWAVVQIEDKRFDYCPDCWNRLQKTIELANRTKK